MRKIIDFLKSRPTETWLGLWLAVVAIIWGTEDVPSWTTAVSTIIAWLVTLFAAQPSNDFGPQPEPLE